jgi:aspartate carbamoyltransferase catalytic subunit
MGVNAETQNLINETLDQADLAVFKQPMNADPTGKDFLSMHQLDKGDINYYMREAEAAEDLVQTRHTQYMLPGVELRVVMRQPSTRTAGTMMTAIHKLGGAGVPVGGMEASAEAKGESLADSWLAFATQSDVIATRTAETHGPAYAAHVISQAVGMGQLKQPVPVINLGDETNEHPTQTIGDLFTIYKKFETLDRLTLAVVGDQERYRAHHSLLIAAAALGMSVLVVESPAAPLPEEYVDLLGDRLLHRTDDLDEVLSEADVLYMGRNPDEYDGDDEQERFRSEQLAKAFGSWILDFDRLQQMPEDSIAMHPRPRNDELHPSVDVDHRMKDVQQMANMVPARMAIIANQFGRSLGALTQ